MRSHKPKVFQRTIKRPVCFSGIGLHNGKQNTVRVNPSKFGGIKIRRTDNSSSSSFFPGTRRLPPCLTTITATYNKVVNTQLCTVIAHSSTATQSYIHTVEHLLASIFGCGIDSAEIEVEGGEVPILDGSSLPFVNRLLEAGEEEIDLPKSVLRILKPIHITDGNRSVQIVPHNGFSISASIHFESKLIGEQSFTFNYSRDAFLKEIAAARTFVEKKDVDKLQQAGLIKGGSLDVALVFDNNALLSPTTLRYPDECVRHKILDVIGDLSLCGASMIMGHYTGIRPGHSLNNRLLHEVFSDSSNFTIEQLDGS